MLRQDNVFIYKKLKLALSSWQIKKFKRHATNLNFYIRNYLMQDTMIFNVQLFQNPIIC